MIAFPWAVAMQFGFGVLKLTPSQFWAMTPRELQSAYEAFAGRTGAAPMARSRLEALMVAHPDGPRNEHGERQ